MKTKHPYFLMLDHENEVNDATIRLDIFEALKPTLEECNEEIVEVLAEMMKSNLFSMMDPMLGSAIRGKAVLRLVGLGYWLATEGKKPNADEMLKELGISVSKEKNNAEAEITPWIPFLKTSYSITKDNAKLIQIVEQRTGWGARKSREWFAENIQKGDK